MTSRTVRCVPAAMAAAFAISKVAVAQTITNIGVLSPSHSMSVAVDVSDDGSVVVGYSDGRGFRWTRFGGFQAFTSSESYASTPYGVSGDGHTAVGQGDTQYSSAAAFRWTLGAGMSSFGSSGSFATAASTDAAVVVGALYSGSRIAARWSTASGMQLLGQLSPGADSIAWGVSDDGSIIVGEASSSQGQLAFRWTGVGGMVSIGVLPGGATSVAKGVSGDGSTVAGWSDTSSGVRAFRWTSTGGMRSLGVLPGGHFSSAAAISADGTCVVGRGTQDGKTGPFVWHSALGMVSLRDLLDARGADLSGWTELLTATGVSAHGQHIVGSGLYEGAERAFVVNLGAPLPYACVGNIVDDGAVDGKDLASVLVQWGDCDSTTSCSADVSGDGVVNGEDLAIILGAWGNCPIVPEWAVALDYEPDPAVVTDSTLQAAIAETGYAWRVRDTATQIEMVLIPPGTFQMGCSASNQSGCTSVESPLHAVTLTSAFYMGRYEVTQAQWQASMGSNPSQWQNASAQVPAEQVPNRPVERVSWNAIQGFLSATGMRLPTEAEWEYAYRAGTTTAFHSMPGYPNGTDDHALLGTIAWFTGSAGIQTRPVGQLAGNGFGLHDMSGNVWEWVNDWYGDSYYASSPSVNPPGPSSGSDRVLRGGSWPNHSNFCRSSFRLSIIPSYGDGSFGFRVARNP